MQKAQVILIMMLFSYYIGYGQGSLSIFGHLRNEAGENLASATVVLIWSNDTLKTLSTRSGEFKFVLQGSAASTSHRIFEIRVTMQGYKELSALIKVPPDQVEYILPPLVLSLQYEDMVPITVLGIKPIAILKDTVEYHAGAYKLRPGDELERLMKRLPGVDWDTSGNFMVDGKAIHRIMLNGQDFVGGDIKVALQKLPADIIDKVQIIDDYGAKAKLTGIKSGESEKVLNIVLKEDKRNGEIINLDYGIGSKGRYNGSLFSDLFAGNKQLSLNSNSVNLTPSGDLRDKLIHLGFANKWNPAWSGNVTLDLWGDTHRSSSSMSQDSYIPNSQQYQEQSILESGNNRNEMISLSQKYVPGENTRLEASAFLGIYHDQETTNGTFITTEQDSGFTKTDSGYQNNAGHINSKVTGLDIYFEKKGLPTGQKMSTSVSYRDNTKQQEENNLSQTRTSIGSLVNTTIQNYIISTSYISREIKAHFDYYFPLGKTNLLELGYAWNYTTTTNDQTTRTPDSANKSLITVDSLSNNFVFSTSSNPFHAGYLSHIKNLNMNLMLDAQPQSQQGETMGKGGKQTYHNFVLLPLAEVSYTLSPRNEFRFIYRGSSTMPALQQIQPLINQSNPQYPVQGNPGLQPSYTHSAILGYDLSTTPSARSWGLSAQLTYSTTRNMIISNLLHLGGTSAVIQKTTYVNANGSSFLIGNYRLNFPSFLHQHLKITATGLFSREQDVLMSDSVIYPEKKLTFNQGLQISLVLPNIVETDLSGYYSYSTSRNSTPGSGTNAYPAFVWTLHSRHMFFQKWILDYSLTQPFTSTLAGHLQANSVLFNTSVKRDFFTKNQIQLAFSVNDLLNAAAGISQSISPTSQTINRTNLIGRYYLITVVMKLERFRKQGTNQNIFTNASNDR